MAHRPRDPVVVLVLVLVLVGAQQHRGGKVDGQRRGAAGRAALFVHFKVLLALVLVLLTTAHCVHVISILGLVGRVILLFTTALSIRALRIVVLLLFRLLFARVGVFVRHVLVRHPVAVFGVCGGRGRSQGATRRHPTDKMVDKTK